MYVSNVNANFTASFEWVFCTNWSHSKKSAILDGKKVWHPPLGHREQKKVKLDRLEFLSVRIYYILLPLSMVDFVPCDQLVQKAHWPILNEYKQLNGPLKLTAFKSNKCQVGKRAQKRILII